MMPAAVRDMRIAHLIALPQRALSISNVIAVALGAVGPVGFHHAFPLVWPFRVTRAVVKPARRIVSSRFDECHLRHIDRSRS